MFVDIFYVIEFIFAFLSFVVVCVPFYMISNEILFVVLCPFDFSLSFLRGNNLF